MTSPDYVEPGPISRVFIVGGAGFIGSHFADQLLLDRSVAALTIFDNFSSGREWHINHHRDDPRFNLVRGDVTDLPLLTRAMEGHETVIHLASIPTLREP